LERMNTRKGKDVKERPDKKNRSCVRTILQARASGTNNRTLDRGKGGAGSKRREERRDYR